jgi:drug/metabolite transporter (DMT)-like permease
MKNVRLVIIGISLVGAVIYLADFFIVGNHPFPELAAGISLLLVSAVFIVSSRRSNKRQQP